MNAIIEEETLQDNEEYEYIPHDEVAEGTRTIIEKHFEALKALADA